MSAEKFKDPRFCITTSKLWGQISALLSVQNDTKIYNPTIFPVIA